MADHKKILNMCKKYTKKLAIGDDNAAAELLKELERYCLAKLVQILSGCSNAGEEVQRSQDHQSVAHQKSHDQNP